jgi:hypothetical protein
MLIREHRGGYQESMQTVAEISNSMNAVRVYICEALSPFGFYTKEITIKPYRFDERNSWDTYIITVKGYGVFGFCNQNVTE